jgi:hypothetical protein
VLSETLNLPNINVIDSFHFEVSVIVQTVNDNDIKKQPRGAGPTIMF